MFQVNLALMNGEESRQKSTVKAKVLQFMLQFFLLRSILCFCVHTRWLNKSMGFLYWSVNSKSWNASERSAWSTDKSVGRGVARIFPRRGESHFVKQRVLTRFSYRSPRSVLLSVTKRLKKRKGGRGEGGHGHPRIPSYALGFLASQRVNKSYLTIMARSSGIKFSLVSQQSSTDTNFCE